MGQTRRLYKVYTREFKINAVKKVLESGLSIGDVAIELDVRRNQLYKWAHELKVKGDEAFKGRGRPKKDDQSILTSLRQENGKLREEVDILKKAKAYFWGEPK